MKICAVETTGEYLGVCVLIEKKGAQVCWSVFDRKPFQQSDLIVPTLDRFLKNLKIRKEDIDFWAVDIGPGSFTGVRVGVSVGRAAAQGLRKPLIGLASLEAMAYQLAPTPKKNLISCVRPALKGDVYGALYFLEGKELSVVQPPVWMKEESFNAIQEKIRKRYSQFKFQVVAEEPHPENLARLAYERIKGENRKKNELYRTVVPLYLQPSWAERSHKK